MTGYLKPVGSFAVCFCAIVAVCLATAHAVDGSQDEMAEGEAPGHAENPDVPVQRFVGGIPDNFPFPGDPRPYAESPHAKTIDRALAYLAYVDRAQNRWAFLTILDYMQRKHHLHERYSLRVTWAEHLRGEEDVPVDERFERFSNPEYVPDADIFENASETERFMLGALYCDLFPEERAGALAQLKKEIEEDIGPMYFRPLMAYIWMRDNECIADTRDNMLIRDTLAVKYRNYLTNQGVAGVLGPQALASLFALGRAEMVKGEWLEQLAEAQNDDGGWSPFLGTDVRGVSETSVTVYALWALLEHARPDASHVPLIARPSGE